MKMTTGKFTTRGRITIPAALRKKYKLHPGTKVKFVAKENGIKIITPNSSKNKKLLIIKFMNT